MSAPALHNPIVRGSEYRQTHSATVLSVLANRPEPPPRIYSRGSQFFNHDRWTGRVFLSFMCEWAKANPGCIPTSKEVGTWVDKANTTRVPDRYIVIANTPDRLSTRTAMALTGGAYHEAWHTLYSCRRSLNVDEMCAMILPRWAKIPHWDRYHLTLQEWSNIVEDVRIERLGCVEFPGSPGRMMDLQDFILEMERESGQNARKHAIKAGVDPKNMKANPHAIVMMAFRDKGLGYQTATQAEAWQTYGAENPDILTLVTKGPLKPLLDEAIALTAEDDLGCLRIAMDVLVELVSLSDKDLELEDSQRAKEGQPGDGKQTCSSCGAPADKLIVRPKSDGRGGKVKGVGICTCTVCGHQDEVPVKKAEKSKAPTTKQPQPKWEGWDKEDFEDEEGEGGEPEGEGEGEGEEGEGEGKGKGKGEEGEGEGEEGEGKGEEGEGEGDDPDSSDGKWSDTFTDHGFDPSEQNGPVKPDNSKQKGASRGVDKKASDAVAGNDFSALVNSILDAIHSGVESGLLDNNTALAEAVASAVAQENGPVLKGEQVYNAFDPAGDRVEVIKPSSRGLAWDRQQARSLIRTVQQMTSYLRARLAQMFRALEQTDTTHGMRYGEDLSEPYLVESALEIRAYQEPSRAYFQKDVMLDLSMAVAIVLDESSSMMSTVNMGGEMLTLTQVATRLMIAITEPLDLLGIPVQVTGFRDGDYYSGNGYHPKQGETKGCHRVGSHHTDVFKMFAERFLDVSWRFANTRAVGGTPMADGMQFGLNSLEGRPEGHRVMFVITDGCPSGDMGVIERQLRLAKEAGILIVGVGLGEPAKYVRDLFPDHVWSLDFDKIPNLLLGKLNAMMDKTASKRGRRMAAS